jgi:hypothetical protein
MADRHLVNAIRFLRRNALGWMMGQLEDMDRYIADAPDMASMAVEEEAGRLAEMTDEEYLSAHVPTYDALLKEAARRKLEL